MHDKLPTICFIDKARRKKATNMLAYGLFVPTEFFHNILKRHLTPRSNE